jgi:hypothetical protein
VVIGLPFSVSQCQTAQMLRKIVAGARLAWRK